MPSANFYTRPKLLRAKPLDVCQSSVKMASGPVLGSTESFTAIRSTEGVHKATKKHRPSRHKNFPCDQHWIRSVHGGGGTALRIQSGVIPHGISPLSLYVLRSTPFGRLSAVLKQTSIGERRNIMKMGECFRRSLTASHQYLGKISSVIRMKQLMGT